MGAPQRRDPWAWAAVLLPSLALAWQYARLPIVATGDGYAAYFPVVWALQDGRGAAAFEALQYGYIRMPAYPLALYLWTALGASLPLAIGTVGVLSAAAALAGVQRVAGAWLGARAAALGILLLVTSRGFLHAAFVSTPDLLALALLVWAFGCSLADGPGEWAAAGALAGLSVLARINLIFLPPLVLVLCAAAHPGQRRRALLASSCGLLLPLAAWSALSVARGELFWLPQGPSELQAKVFHPAILAQGDDLRAALAAEPLALLGRSLLRLLITGPAEVAGHACGPLPSALALAGILWGWRRADRKRACAAGALVGLSWLAMALSHFEARYYPVPVAAACCLAGWTVSAAVDRAPLRPGLRHAGLAMLVALVLALRAGDAASFAANHQTAARFVEQTGRVAEVASRLPGGCIALEEVAYRMTAFRWKLRELGPDRSCCCTASSEAGALVALKGWGHLEPEKHPERFEPVTVEGGSELLQLYRVRTATRAR